MALVLHPSAHHVPLPYLKVVAGALLLFFGRKLFWLFVAAIGFAVGLGATTYFLPHSDPWIGLIVGVLMGVIGAFIAIFLQKIAIALAGFLAGGHVALLLMYAVHAPQHYLWIDFLIGGILGAVLLLGLFGWALIVLTCVEGAKLVSEGLSIHGSAELIVLVVLIVAGFAVQASMKRNSK